LKRYIARRIAISIPLLLIVSVLVFLLIHAVPGGPVEVFLSNPNVRPEDVERLRAALGLDRPLTIQYLSWLKGFVTGDWGYSFSDGRPVFERLAERLPATIELMLTAIVVGLIAAFPVGILSAVWRNGWLDRIASTVSFAGIALPVFWFGLILQLIFAVGLGWLPSSGRTDIGDASFPDRLEHLILPAIVLASVHAAVWSRFLRSSMITTLQQTFMTAATARGLPFRSRMFRHALRNAMMPVITVIAIDAAIMVSGAVMTESVFAWPGLGSLFTDALARRDYTVLMAFLMTTSLAVVTLNLLADVTYRILDPRTVP